MTTDQTNRKPTVAIFGAGIAGLAAAHEAAQIGFHVEVYECDDTAGGFAKSDRTEDNMPTEYSWRGYGPWYHNVFKLMKEIPSRTCDGSVYDKELSRQINFAIVPDHLKKKSLGLYDSFSRLDYIRFVLTMLRGFVADKRGHEVYATLNAAQYLKPRLSVEAHKAIVSTFGPWIGTDSLRTSLHHLCTFHRKNKWPRYYPTPYLHPKDEFGGPWYHQGNDGWLVMRGPTSEAWFDPWVSHLKKNGVQFKFGHELLKFKANNTEISSAIVREKNSNIDVSIKADHYIMAITPFAAQKVVAASSGVVQDDSECKKFSDLIADGPHIQIAFQIGFSEKIEFPSEWQAIILRDSEYCLTIFPDDLVFRKDIDLGGNVKSLWTGTTTWSYLPDKVTGRTVAECTKEDFVKGIFNQIFRSEGLEELIVNANKGRGLKTFPIVQTEVWNSWSFPKDYNNHSEVTAPQPKWSNTTNTQSHHPSAYTSLKNLILAGSHTKVSADLWSMEGAAESGRRAVVALNLKPKIILENSVKPEVIEHEAPIFFRVCSKIDNFLYAIKLPNLIDVILIIFFVAVIACGGYLII
jgi:hypothetical protein